MPDNPGRRQRLVIRLHQLTRNSLVEALARRTGTMHLNSSDTQTDQVEELVTFVGEREAIAYTSLYFIPAFHLLKAELFMISTIVADRRQTIRVGLLEALYNRAPPSFYTTFTLEDASSDANEAD
ncbi:hypothetical protein CC2G_004093 [Coprinopsis cinerea AmutBmut pab1-1]|nr:hypothetical protein CC2G_004093 [Coprinopsis cinerea AmutBmut pab1-1]